MQKCKTLLTVVQVPGPSATTRAFEFYGFYGFSIVFYCFLLLFYGFYGFLTRKAILLAKTIKKH